MTWVEEWLPSATLAVLVGIILVLAVLASILRESWLGDAATNDPALVGVERAALSGRRARRKLAALRIGRTVVAVLLSLGLVVLAVATVARFASMAAS